MIVLAVVLVGMMGSGKTTIGQRLADRLGGDFVDSDAEVEARTGRTVAEIWEAEGEAAFRRLEAESLRSALERHRSRPAVVAAAGGVVLDPANRELLRRRASHVVWLRAQPATLASRIGGEPGHRPLLREDPAETLERLHEERAGLYRAVASTVVDVDGIAPETAVERILRSLQGGEGGDG